MRKYLAFTALAAMVAGFNAQSSKGAVNTVEYGKSVTVAGKAQTGKRAQINPGAGSGYKHRITPPKNQQQRREKLRRCPHLRHSKKNPL